MLIEQELERMALAEGERITLLAILAVLMILVLYFEMRVMRGRSKATRKMSIRKDEAYNAILTCRSVINVMERQGASVHEARALVDKAKSHMQRGEHEIAIDLCEKARDELTKARSKPREPSARPSAARRDALEDVAEDIVSSSSRRRPTEDSYSGSKLEVQGGPNYLVAKFELNTAREEIARAEGGGSDVSGAKASLDRAQAEFDAGNYAKALSMAVKAKKAVSTQGTEDTIRLKGTERVERPTEAIDGEAAGVVDVCSSCGSEIDPEDTFCGSCGNRREKERVCSSCGRVATGSDKFCRKCGSKVP